MRRQSYELLIAALLVLVTVFARFLPHPPNFSPVLAAALFAGTIFSNRTLAYLLPLVAIFVSDLFLGFYDGISFVYFSYVMIVAMGALVRPPRVATVVLGSLGASLVFFVMSNLGVWLFSGLYEGNSAGLVQCFASAIPFFHATLVSTMVSSVVIFAIYARVRRRMPSAVRVLR